ncbi:hypothetical protein [Neobacillus sp. PS2-9]|uniref:hypothetical protein n=1 Tax=Neobacillus sp. PS2-9 TaxID=3070676 RepID=UPI0027E0FDB8|nr:hypothetical protein [Neobacillus sp. PS2-9]WML57054.1 hypothetical protein RCG25_19295 [Neobacillus sp. PS2-9]
MDSMQRDREAYYKKIEAQMNKRIHATTNNRAYTLAAGRALEAHLKRVKIHRRLTTKWLNHIGLVNKDELTALSVRIVDYEGKIDGLDDQMYTLNKSQHKNQLQLNSIHRSLEEWVTFLRNEMKDLHSSKINNLEKELLELKQLFKEEFDLEEIDND